MERGNGTKYERRPYLRHFGALALVAIMVSPLSAKVGQAGGAQQTSPSYTPPGSTRPTIGGDPLEGTRGALPGPPNSPKLEHMREDERHKRLESDTARLVELTNELKTEVDKASKDELSLDVVRKAAEIEKLAHDVKERMKS